MWGVREGFGFSTLDYGLDLEFFNLVFAPHPGWRFIGTRWTFFQTDSGFHLISSFQDTRFCNVCQTGECRCFLWRLLGPQAFHGARVPRHALLSRYGEVQPGNGGSYVTKVKAAAPVTGDM